MVDNYTLVKAAWIGSEVGAVVLGLRSLGITPIVDIAGVGGFEAFALAVGLAGAVSLSDKVLDFDY